MNWITISCILCIFGCFKDFRPSESFVTNYLMETKNFTEIQVNQDIYPIGTYAHFATLVIVFLITDFVRYKSVIILCGLSGVTTFILMIWGQDILTIQILEFFYGLFLSTEVAYYTYIYAKVDKKHYQEVTGHTKAASLFGRCMAGIVAQLTTSFEFLNYHQLNYLTLSAILFATVWAFFLPSVGESIYFHRKDSGTSTIADGIIKSQDNLDHTINNIAQDSYMLKHQLKCSSEADHSLIYKIRRAYKLLGKDFLQAYSNWYVVKWSIWWALSSCGYVQVISYAQLLWQTAVEPGEKLYNGAVDFLYAIIGSVTVFCIGKISFNWALIGDITVSLMSLLEGTLLILSFYSYNIWFLYTVHILLGIIYHTMVTVASFEVAKHISKDSYGLIFGTNILVALLLQSLLTAIVINGNLSLDLRAQFCVYGAYFIVIAILYMIVGIINIIKHCRSGVELKIWAESEVTEIES